MIAYLWVAIGGALGSVGRYWLGGIIADRAGMTFPLGTLVINVTGSFLIGLFASLNTAEGRAGTAPGFRQFFMIGICGGYTTFSTFSLETLNLLRDRQWFYAGGNVLLSVLLCLVAVWLGWLLGSMFNSMKGN
jgi:fluoride exporter